MQIKGHIYKIGPTQSVGANNFQKREVVISTAEQYPQLLAVEFIKDMTLEVDDYAEGEGVTVDINLKGREWINPQGEAKYFNQIQGWRIGRTGARTNQAPAQEAPAPKHGAPKPAETTQPGADFDLDQDDDLPF